MTNLASKDSHDEKSSVFSVTYHEIGETYTGLKENVTEKLSNYLLTYGAALAHHPSIKEEEKKEEEPIDPLKQEIEKETKPEDTRENIETEIENTEPIIETKKEKKKKKKDKKEKKNKKKK